VTGEILILAHATDLGARSVAARLSSGPDPPPVRTVRPELLGLAGWSHRVDPAGKAFTQVSLPRARPLLSSGTRAVLNRVRYLQVPRFRKASARDRDYAAAELHAVVASWLCGMGDQVVQPVRTHPWVTPWLSRQHWVEAAAGAGLPVEERRLTSAPPALPLGGPDGITPPAESSSPLSVLVAGPVVGGALAARYGGRCLTAAGSLGLPLLEFRFGQAGGKMRLLEVDPLPLLLEPWAVALVADLLLARAVERR
jgi:hypothetical protein